MAPKRTNTTTKSHPAKKAKTLAPEAPLLAFLGSVKEMPKQCRDMLQVAVPFCLEVVEAERHKFQVDILNRVAGLLTDMEHKKRDAVGAGEAELAQVDAEKEKAFAENEAKKMTASTKQNACEEKGKFVDAAREVVASSQKVLTTAQEQEKAFNEKRAALHSEQENFAKLLSEGFQPLKDGTLAGTWQKRHKVIVELKKKMLDLGAQASLGEAFEAALKMKPEKREGAFAKATMRFTEELFEKHTTKVTQDISSLDPEASSLKAAIDAAEAVHAMKKGELQVVNGEWDEMQNVWLQLEKEFAEATSNLNGIEAQIPDISKSIEKAKADLDKFLEVPALFSNLKEHSTAVPDEPDAVEEVEEDGAAVEEADGVAEATDEAVQE